MSGVLLGVYTFAAPALFAGMALVSLPLIAHLLHRRTRQRIVFPTIAFLKQTTASQSRLFRLRRWILLLLRCAAAAAIVLAFTRPSWLDAASPAGQTGAAVVFVIDGSASTKQLTAGAPLFDRLRAAAGRTLDGLTPGVDGAAIVLATARPRRSLPKLTTNLDAVRSELASLAPTDERADMAAALASAGELLRSRREGRVMILSDLQSDNWREILDSESSRDLFPPGTQVSVVEPDVAAPDNLALSNPRTSPTEPLAGAPVRLIVEAANFSGRRKQAKVECRIDGELVGSQTLDLEAGQRLEAGFDATLDSLDSRAIVFSLAPDDFPSDDRAFLALGVRPPHPVTVISDDDPKDANAGLFYLVRALAPRGDEADRFAVRLLRGAEVSLPDRAPKFAADETLVVCDADGLNEVGADRIRKQVQDGSGLLAFRSDAPLDSGLSTLDADPAGANGAAGWLPLQTGVLRRLERQQALTIQGGQWRSRFLRSFDDSAQTAFSRAPFYRVTEGAPLRPNAERLLTFSDGSPALLVAPKGRGWIAQTAFSPSAASTDLSKFGVFVALVQTLVQELRDPPDQTVGCRPGRSCRIIAQAPRPGDPAAVSVTGPDGQPLGAAVTLGQGGLNVEPTAASSLGFLRVAQGTRTLGLGAVNLDPLESNLARVPAATLAEKLSSLGARTASVNALALDEPAVKSGGRALWGWCFASAVVLLGLELALLSWWKR